MPTSSQRIEPDENQEILDLLENSAVNFVNAELDRSRLRKIRDNQDNFDFKVWEKIGALGWLDLLSTDQNKIKFIAQAIKLIAHQMGTKGAPEPFMESGIGPLSLLNGVSNYSTPQQLSKNIIRTQEKSERTCKKHVKIHRLC